MPVVNWAQNLQFTPRSESRPESVDEIVAAVQAAERAGQRVRALGSRWSFSDVIHAEDVVILTEGLKRIHGFGQGTRAWGPDRALFSGLRADVRATDRRFAYFQAGVTVKELYTALDRPGTELDRPGGVARGRWAMLTQGASSGQTVVGAVATGTHGADHGLPPLAGMVRAVHLVGPGGVHHWLERASGFGRITDPAGPLAAIPGLRAENIHYDDERFLAAVVGLGSLGVVVAVVVEAREQYGLSQRLHSVRWSAIKRAYREQRLFNHTFVPSRHPANANGRRVSPIPEALEIFLNPYRVDDQYATSSEGDRSCLVIERARAVAGDGQPDAFDGVFDPPATSVDRLGLMLDVEVHGPSHYRTRIDDVMRTARAETTGYHVAHSVLDTYDGTGEALPALSMEIAVPTSDDRWIRLIDWLLAQFDQLVRRGQKFAGFISLRFTRRSEELLGMQTYEGTLRDHVCHIEIFGLKEINLAKVAAAEILAVIFSGGISLATGTGAQPDIDNSGNFEGTSDQFVKQAEDSIATVDARMHWGQLHRLDRADVEDAYRLTLPRWRRVRTELSSAGRAQTFSNGFTQRCGLESNHEVLAACSWGPNRYDLFTYDEAGNVLTLWWNGRWNWTNLGNHFPHDQRFLGPLTATAWGPGRIDVFGLGRGGELLQMTWNGRWNWIALGRQLPRAPNFLGPLAVSSWENRLDVFGIDHRGLLQQVWWNGRWHHYELGNGFANGQRLSGSLSAVAWGRDRIDIFGLGRHKQLLQVWWNGRWNWTVLDPRFSGNQRFAAAPAVSSWEPGHLDLIGLGPRNNLLHTWWGRGWHADEVTNGFTGEEKLLVTPEGGTDAYYRFEERTQRPLFVGPISGTSSQRGRLDYFGFDREGKVLHLWHAGGWRWSQLGRSW